MTITRWLRGRQQASTMMKAPSNTAALLRLASASNNCTASVPSSPSQQTFSCHENHHHLYIKFGPRDKQHQRRLPSLSCPLVFSPSSSLSFSTSSIPSTPSSPLEEIFGHERDSFYYREISKTNHKPLPVQLQTDVLNLHPCDIGDGRCSGAGGAQHTAHTRPAQAPTHQRQCREQGEQEYTNAGASTDTVTTVKEDLNLDTHESREVGDSPNAHELGRGKETPSQPAEGRRRMRRREASDGRVTLVTFGYNALTMEQTDDWIWRFTQRFNRGIEDRKKGREGGKENRKEGGRMSTHANARANTKDTSGSTYDDQSVAQRHVRTTKKEGNYGRKEGREEEEHGRHDHHRLLQQKRRRKQEDRQRQVVMAERLTTKPGETDESVGNAENASKDDADVNMDNMNVSNMNVNGSQDDNSGIKVKSKTDMKGNSDAIQRDDMSSASSLSLVPSPSPSLSTRLPRLDHPSVDYFQFSFQFSLWMFQSNLLHSAASQYDTERREKMALIFDEFTDLRRQLGMMNRFSSFIFLVDSRGRIRWRSSGLPWSQEDFLAQTAESKTMQSEIQARSPLTLHPRADAPSHADTHTHTHFRALSPGASVSSSASLSSLETEDEIDVLVRVTLELLEEGEEEGDIFPLLY